MSVSLPPAKRAFEEQVTRLVALGRKARQGLATPQELEELNELEQGFAPG